MTEKGLYFAKPDFYNIIRKIGGSWNDSKERPIVCLLKSTESPELYWAIPIGNWKHRDKNAQNRIKSYLNSNKNTLRYCYYHLGKTNIKSIFFISDAIPITERYIDREYIGYNNQQYIILNPNLIAELEYKLKRILSYENSNPNFFRQHITDIKSYLLQENDMLNECSKNKQYQTI